MKTKIWIARVDLSVLPDSVAHGAKAPAADGVWHEPSDPRESASHARLRRAESRRFRYDESRRGIESRRFAKPKSSLRFRPTEERRATYANLGSSRPPCRELRRQRPGRVGQSSSSEPNSSRGGLAGFPTGNAARRFVSCKVGEAQSASHRASSSKSRRRWSRCARRTCAHAAERRETSPRGQRASQGAIPCRIAPFLIGRRGVRDCRLICRL